VRLESVSVSNFRCYDQEISSTFSDLTAFVGKNDVGKSTILEALEIFFNNETVKIDSSDRHIHSKDNLVSGVPSTRPYLAESIQDTSGRAYTNSVTITLYLNPRKTSLLIPILWNFDSELFRTSVEA
jgi:predicted ATP-binding protein involved in virulence